MSTREQVDGKPASHPNTLGGDANLLIAAVLSARHSVQAVAESGADAGERIGDDDEGGERDGDDGDAELKLTRMRGRTIMRCQTGEFVAVG